MKTSALTLAKLFELPQRSKSGETYHRRYNRSDVASIPLMIRLLKQRRTRASLIARARHWTPSSDLPEDLHARACGVAIDQAVAAYGLAERKRTVVSALLRLRKFRNKILAHLLLVTPRGTMPTYNDLFLLMDVARNVTGHALLAIDGLDVDFLDLEKKRNKVSLAFWGPALDAASKQT